MLWYESTWNGYLSATDWSALSVYEWETPTKKPAIVLRIVDASLDGIANISVDQAVHLRDVLTEWLRDKEVDGEHSDKIEGVRIERRAVDAR